MVKLFTTVAVSLLASANGATKPIVFKPPFKALDPNHHKDVFDHFRTCNAACIKQKSYAQYGNDAWSAFGTLGDYTACISTCVAHEILGLVTYYKGVYADLLDITHNQLRLAKHYVGGTGDFDLIGNRTRVDYSCVLPDEYFIKFEEVSVLAEYYYFDRHTQWGSGLSRGYVSAEQYLFYCSNNWDGDWDSKDFNAIDDDNGFGGLKIGCNFGTYSYLKRLKQSVGYTILHPDNVARVPDGACNHRTDCHVKVKPNPKAQYYTTPLCVAEKVTNYYASQVLDVKDKYAYLTTLLAVLPDNTGACPPIRKQTFDSEHYLEITFKKVDAKDVNLYTVTGLPGSAGPICDLSITSGFPTSRILNSNPNDHNCVAYYDVAPFRVPGSLEFYHNGGLEYSNARQYINHLNYHAFNTANCEGYEDRVVAYTLQDDNNIKYSFACLYRILSLKCDCMQAVLNCYEHETHFTSLLGKTLGRASAVLCGFVLCQREPVYKLFLNAQGLSHTTIIAEVLLQAGQVESNLPFASLALVSFGLGMIAFVAAKQLTRPKSTMEDGYRNLI